jgi:hypothetical protein
MHIIAVCISIVIKNWIFILYKFDDDMSLFTYVSMCLIVPEDGLYVPKHVRLCRPIPPGNTVYIC